MSLADHGFTPTVIAARLTLAGAPEAPQGALAAGLLGGGSVFLGVTEDVSRFLAAALTAHGADLPATDDGWDVIAREAARGQRDAGRLIPGLGHPMHKDGDPRTPVILRIAEEEGLRGRQVCSATSPRRCDGRWPSISTATSSGPSATNRPAPAMTPRCGMAEHRYVEVHQIAVRIPGRP